MNVVVTGGMGSGKSFVSSALAKMLGAENLSADSVCRELLEPGFPGHSLLQKHFPANYFLNNGQLNRPFLRTTIFSDDTVRLQLDTLLHPLVREELLSQCLEAKKKGDNLVVEVPLLFEKKWQSDFDATLVVYADKKTCLKRIMERDKVSTEAALTAMACQMPLAEKCKLTRWLVDNSGDPGETLAQLNKFVHKMLGSEFLELNKKRM